MRAVGGHAAALVGAFAVICLVAGCASSSVPSGAGASTSSPSATFISPTTITATTVAHRSTSEVPRQAPPTTAARPPAARVDLDPSGTEPGLPNVDSPEARAVARAVIARVPTGTDQGMAGYSRLQFGVAWTDDNDDVYGHNGCDTRDDILRRDLADITLRTNTRGCVVLSGTLAAEPYTGRPFTFSKHHATALQIDHILPLGLAWQLGAASWTTARRVDFANDPLELLAVDGPANERKGDDGPATWLPPNAAIHCAYSLRIAQVALRYHLPLLAQDKVAMLAQCQG